MSITRKKFGELNGTDIYAYTLNNCRGMRAEIINYGAIITRLVYNETDVVLGYDGFEGYIDNPDYFGAIIGRNANVIENSEFRLNGKTYKLFPNNNQNNLHGGKEGFDKKVWNAQSVDGDEPSLVLSYFSPDGEEGFPGNAQIKITYTLKNDNALQIHCEAQCDRDTVVNMTNHSYFNLNGHCSGSVEGHTLWLASHFYTPSTSEIIPGGEIRAVDGTPFDFTTESPIANRLAIKHEQIDMFGGYDHNFVLDGRGYRLGGVLKGDKSGITMEMYTDQPGVQIYLPTEFDSSKKYKGGANYGRYGAVCLETQGFPNGINYSHFPDVVLKKGDRYDRMTTYRFK